MSVRTIIKYPDKILKEKTTPLMNIDADTQRLIDDMVETMQGALGIGLAANQVGVAKRLCVVDLSTREEKAPRIILINPVIVEKDGSIEAEEGCLSIPGYLSTVKRANTVYVKALDREGKEFEIEGTGMLARALQHEIDHLDGMLFIDRMNPIKREFFKRRYKKSLLAEKK